VQQRTRLAAYAFSIEDGALLLVRISDGSEASGAWTLPGGGLRWAEHPEDGVRRELHEETGLTGTVGSVLGIDSGVLSLQSLRGADQVHSVRIVYDVACAGSPRVVERNGTVDAARWVPLEDLDRYRLAGLVEFALQRAGLSPGRASTPGPDGEG
jgi:8-oxo-dGTP diphosphatase